MKNRDEFYIDRHAFREEMIEWLELYNKDNTVQYTDSICKKFFLMINGLASRPNFSGYSYIDEMKDLAIFNIMRYGHNYDPYKLDKNGRLYNIFSYYNRTIWQSFVTVILSEKKEQNKKSEYLLKNFSLNNDLFIDGSDGHAQSLEKMAKMYDER